MSTEKFHRTAIARKKLSLPLRDLFKLVPELPCESEEAECNVIDYGCGRGYDAKMCGYAKYDPNHPDPEVRKFPRWCYEWVISNYVANVIPPEGLQEYLNCLAHVGGNGEATRIFISIRDDIPEHMEGNGQWSHENFEELALEIAPKVIKRCMLMKRKKGAYRLYEINLIDSEEAELASEAAALRAGWDK